MNEFIELVSIDSVTGRERKMADTLKQKLNMMGYEVYEDQAAEKTGGESGNLICTVKGSKDVPALLLAAHMDTVEPGLGKKPVVEGGVIKTDGTTVLGGDDVAGIACCLEVLKVLKENNLEHGDLQVVFTVAEEGGLLGSKNLDYDKIYAKYGIVLDSGGPIGTVAVKAPSHNRINAVVKGRSAHAGTSPENGISAIQIAANAISRMKLGRIDFETTANVGVISGGRETNIVCDRVDIKAEARSRDERKLENQTAHMRECFEQAAAELGGSVDIEVFREYSSFNIPKDAKIMRILEKAAEASGVRLVTEETGGGSDTNIFNSKGIEAVNISVGMDKVHTVEEKICIDDLAKAAEFVLSIVLNMF